MSKKIKLSDDKSVQLKLFCKKNKRNLPKLIVKEIMVKKGFSNSDLSLALGLKNPSSAQRLKTSQALTFETMIKIAVVLGVNVRDLIKE